MTETNIQIFNNPEFGEIRTVTINNEPWFVAKDVCDILGITNPTDALNKGLEDFERARFNLGRQGEANIISESGFYTLVLRSRKAIAKPFRVWVTSEILPTVRKTGGYVQETREEEFINTYFPSFSEETKLAMVQDLRAKNEQLTNENKQLKLDNKALSSSILEWEDRSKLNAGMRRLALATKTDFGSVWGMLFKNLKYKYHIDLKSRKKKASEPYIATIKKDEWSKVIQTFAALCEELHQSPSEMIGAA